MIRKLLFISSIFGVLSPILGQSILVNPDTNPASALPIEQLVESVLIDRDNIQLVPSSVRLTQNDIAANSDVRSWGYFNSGTSGFPFQEGIILTTGGALSAEGPNDDDNTSLRGATWPGDADLTEILNNDNISNAPTFNATVLQFDFIPNGASLAFNFIFASEEYENQFECRREGELSDGFAFLIRGPGIPDDSGTSFGGTNIARIPGSMGVPVNTRSIHLNAFDNGSLFRCPNLGTGGVLERLGMNFFPEFYISNPSGSELLQYDGYTTVLPANVTVVPGETYTIKMVIADRGDDQTDSAVFVQGLSASSNVIVENTSAPTPIGENHVICTSDFPQTLTARFVDTPFTGSETYVWRRNDVVISGANTNSIDITQEGRYTVSVTDGSELFRDSIEVTLSRGPETLTFSTNSVNLTQHTVTAVATGIGTFQYSIDNGMFQDSPEFVNVTPGQHTLTVMDQEGCGEITLSFFVTGFPKYFTPNGDGFHDTWNAVGDEDLALITVTIFDRYGKLIASFRADRTGWDGTYNGRLLPSSEYWFKAVSDTGEVFTGHFSLIR